MSPGHGRCDRPMGARGMQHARKSSVPVVAVSDVRYPMEVPGTFFTELYKSGFSPWGGISASCCIFRAIQLQPVGASAATLGSAIATGSS